MLSSPCYPLALMTKHPPYGHARAMQCRRRPAGGGGWIITGAGDRVNPGLNKNEQKTIERTILS
jgi:hypothetical protein